MECSICCEKFNNSNHLKVVCKGCETNESACRSCCQTFILSGTQDPMCMFCKNPWDRDFINKNLTKKFVNKDLKEFSENLFLERQISLLPETQGEAIKEKNIRDITERMAEANIELNRIKKIQQDQRALIDTYKRQINEHRSGTAPVTAVDNFTIKCPSSECKGFLDSKYFCSLCDTKFCRHCMEVKGKDHICDEDTKATVKAINRQSKPCPGCGEMISKIDGCDQMWCIKCHIQFSWKTGVRITGYNHNPEYFRWLRETGQQINRNPHELNREIICGVEIDDYTITRIISNVFHNDRNMIGRFQLLYRFYRHVEVKLNFLDHRDEDNEYHLRSLRVKYLLGDIGKEQWKRSIQQVDKKTKKTHAYNNIWRLILTVITSYIEQIITCSNENANSSAYIKIIQEANNFKDYANASFCNASAIFGSTSCPGIDDYWREVYNYKRFLAMKREAAANQVAAVEEEVGDRVVRAAAARAEARAAIREAGAAMAAAEAMERM